MILKHFIGITIEVIDKTFKADPYWKYFNTGFWDFCMIVLMSVYNNEFLDGYFNLRGVLYCTKYTVWYEYLRKQNVVES